MMWSMSCGHILMRSFFLIFPDGEWSGGLWQFQSHFILIQCGKPLCCERILMRIFFPYFLRWRMEWRSITVPVQFHPYTMWKTSELWTHTNENFFFQIFPDGALGGGPCPFQSHFILIQCGIHLSYENIIMRSVFLFFQMEHWVEVHRAVLISHFFAIRLIA